MRNKPAWEGTAAELLHALNAKPNPNITSAWPKTPSRLSGRLRRIATIMRSSGINIEMGIREGKDSKKLIRITNA